MRMKPRRILTLFGPLVGLLALAIFAWAPPGPARAATDAAMTEWASPWGGIEEAGVRLIASRVPGVGDMLGLHFVMQPEWSVYWRSPGETGIPPALDWTGSSGSDGMALQWPLPKRFAKQGMISFGYENEVVLPVRLQRDGGPVAARLNLQYAVCAEICVPVFTELRLDLPAGGWPESAYGEAIALAIAQTPLKSPSVLKVASAALAADSLTLVLATDRAVTGPDLIIEGAEELGILGRPVCAAQNRRTRCQAPLTPGPKKRLIGRKLVLTLYGPAYAAETEFTVGQR